MPPAQRTRLGTLSLQWLPELADDQPTLEEAWILTAICAKATARDAWQGTPRRRLPALRESDMVSG